MCGKLNGLILKMDLGVQNVIELINLILGEISLVLQNKENSKNS